MRKKDLNTKRDSHDSRHTQDCSVGSGRITARYSSSPPIPRSNAQTAEKPLRRRLIGAVAGIHPAFALLVALTVALIVPLAVQTAWAQDNGSIEYAENGTGAVATYTAVDPEGTDIVSWSLSGDDSALFNIAGGVLAFKKSPDFEDANSDNMHAVTVQATDATNKVGMKEVTVEVTNVDEPGTVTLSALRPQSAIEFTATHSDPDGDITGAKWQWSKASSRNGSYTDIEDATSRMYTPKDADVGSYLRASITYKDAESKEDSKSASERSAHAVQGVPGDNAAPKFADDQDPVADGVQANAAREVAENTPAGQAIGDPVVAEDDDGEVLTYTLTGDDAASFDIDWATGQIMTKAALDADTKATYEVMVRATDPSGIPQAQNAVTDNSDTVTVDITVTDVNEAPDVTGETELTFNVVVAATDLENGETSGSIDANLHTYQEDNPEDNVDSTWSLAGDDAGKFEIDNGALTFEAAPDFEAPGDANTDNVYEVTVVAADADGNRGTQDVKVTVVNVGETGTVTLSRTQPRVGVSVTASLTDPDGSVSGLTWQWASGGTDIEDATSDTYTPKDGDVDTLTATASYTDGHGPGKSATVTSLAVAEDTRNKAPTFADQDAETDGVQNESADRKVEENTKALAGADDDDAVTDAAADNVGSAVMATDPDPNTDPLIYALGGADAALFRVRDNGQIEVAAGTKLDYETQTSYSVTLTAEDSFGASASIMVTITVTDMDEAPDVTGDAAAEYAEKGMGAVATYTAVDPEETDIVSWSLSGDDSALFNIAGGVLAFKKSPDFEDDTSDNVHEVTVQATDETNKVGTKDVTIEVTNVDEPGTVTLSALRPQSAIVFTATHSDPDGTVTDAKWQWSKASSRNGSYTDIDDAISSTYMPKDADVGSYLRATVTYKDAESKENSKSASERSAHAAQGVPGDNAAPKFADDQDPVMENDQADAAREVAENTAAGQAIGDPVVAEDDDGEVLTYTLAGTDAESFDIDWATGQIMTKAALDFETDPAYEVVVRATDPSGIPQALTADADNSDTVTVNITVNNVNEAPDVTGNAEVTFAETGAIAPALDTYQEDNPEDNVVSTWSLAGDDAGKFEIDNGELTFEAQPDFETPGDSNTDNVYEVTVVAADADGNRGTQDVKVTVTNVDEPGTVTLSRTQPRVGVSVTASLADPDGSVSGLTWQWYDGTVDDNNLETNAIDDANSDTYTPTADDVDDTLTARASYTDGEDSGKSAEGAAANAVAADTRNKAPEFGDEDTETDGVQNETAERKVSENTMALASDDGDDDDVADNVGSMVMATDPDPNSDPLMYTLGGPDAALFRVRDNGQIEVAAGTELDYETETSYSVMVMAEDSFGATASIMVTINVEDMDEAPVITRVIDPLANRAPMFATSRDTRSVNENTAAGMDIGDPVEATDPNAGDVLAYTLSGANASNFTIDGATGQLMTMSALDYETKTSYTVTVRATDGDGLYDSVAVTINVGDVENEDQTGYDADGDGSISKSELITAIRDYLGMTTTTLDKPGLIAVIRAYLGL